MTTENETVECPWCMGTGTRAVGDEAFGCETCNTIGVVSREWREKYDDSINDTYRIP